MAGFLTAAMAAIGSSGVGSALVRILLAYGVSRLINGSTGGDNSQTPVDQGIRLQVAPDTTNPIPLVFGSAYLGGKITDAQITDANQTMWYCLTIAEVPVVNRLSDNAAITVSFDEIYWNHQRVYFQADGVTIDYIVNQDGVVDTSARGLVKIYLYKNGSAAPVLPSDLSNYQAVLPALPAAANTLMPGWTANTTMTGLSFALVKISYNRDKNITGLQDIQFKLSNNLYKPGDAIYSYLRNNISGCGFDASQIDTVSLSELNAYAAETVNYLDEADGVIKTLANRYQMNGVINPTDNVMTNLQKLGSNAGCFVNYDIGTGLWGMTINRDQAPVLAFNDSNIISGVDLTGTSLDSMFNAVEVEFPHRELRDQIDSIRIALPAEFRNANEPDNILKIRLDLINEPLQARELGYLELYQNRMDQVITFTSDYSKINTEAGDVITITNEVYGWVTKQFRVIRVREVESESGGIAVEITAQEYDSTMYTAGGQARRPRVPTQAIGIPGIAVIGTPPMPTIVQINSVAVPAINVTGLTPAGIVDQFEFWYSDDAGVNYHLLGISRNANGAPYNQGTPVTYRADKLGVGSYLFKVRGGNSTAFGQYSDPTASIAWTPIQVTDAVTAATQVTGGGLSSLLGPLAMGAIAYFAYQALYPEAMKLLGDTAVGEALGIPTSAMQEMKSAAGNFKLINAGGALLSPYNNDTITFEAGDGITIEATALDSTIKISSTNSATGFAFNTFTIDSTVITAAVDKTNVIFEAGVGIKLEAFPESNTIVITVDPTNTGGGGGGGPSDGPTEASIKSDQGEINATNTFVMDNCLATNALPPKLKTRPTPDNKIAVKSKYITGEGTYVSDCYHTTFPTLVIPGHGFAPNTNTHPMTQGSFILRSDNPILDGKTIYLKAISNVQVIAYCNFDNYGNALPIPASSCSIEPPESRPVFSTIEFPPGHRLVTYAMMKDWTPVEGTNGLPINRLEYIIVPGNPTNTYYDTNYEVTQHARICQNADKKEPIYSY